jgi:integrase
VSLLARAVGTGPLQRAVHPAASGFLRPSVLPIEAVDVTRYDRTPTLSRAERTALSFVVEERAQRPHRGHWPGHVHRELARLLRPVADVMAATGIRGVQRYQTAAILQAAMHARQTAYWGWTRAAWLEVFRAHVRSSDCRQQVLACMYLLGGVDDVRVPGVVCQLPRFADAMLGAGAVAAATGRLREELGRWGWTAGGAMQLLHRTVSVVLLAARSRRLEDVSAEVLQRVLAAAPSPAAAAHVHLVARGLVGLGLLPTLPTAAPAPAAGAAATGAADPWLDHPERLVGVPPSWAGWCRRWYDTSTLAVSTRRSTYYILLKAGRWLAATHPEAATPPAWTRDLAAAYVAAVDRLTQGAWVQAPAASRFAARRSQPLAAHAKLHHLTAMRGFFRDCQEWGWIPRRFDPGRALAAPRSRRAAAGPAPRVIADDVWAKLLWAGLNLTAADLPVVPLADAPWYPVALVRALVVTWLFAGLRWDELRRLRVGCIRWQRGDVTVVRTSEPPAVLPKDAVCWLDVPVNKTMTAFTKPVDRAVGEAIATWEAARPAQPPLVDPKTGEVVDFLLMYRGRRLGPAYLNHTLIPLLCRKAGLPRHDARGSLSGHRARSTIASQLANAREPLTLLELMAWLGHRSPASTQHYVAVAPTRLEGLRRRRVLPAQRPPGGGAGRPRGGGLRRGRHRRALAVLRPGPRVLHLRLLRPVPPPHGLRQVPLLPPQGLDGGATPRRQDEPAPPVAGDPLARGRAGRGRGWHRRPRAAPGQPRRCAYAGRRADAPAARSGDQRRSVLDN